MRALHWPCNIGSSASEYCAVPTHRLEHVWMPQEAQHWVEQLWTDIEQRLSPSEMQPLLAVHAGRLLQQVFLYFILYTLYSTVGFSSRCSRPMKFLYVSKLLRAAHNHDGDRSRLCDAYRDDDAYHDRYTVAFTTAIVTPLQQMFKRTMMRMCLAGWCASRTQLACVPL